MECFRDVPGVLGPRPVWMDRVRSGLRALVEDDDWDRLIERERSPFGLLTAE